MCHVSISHARAVTSVASPALEIESVSPHASATGHHFASCAKSNGAKSMSSCRASKPVAPNVGMASAHSPSPVSSGFVASDESSVDGAGTSVVSSVVGNSLPRSRDCVSVVSMWHHYATSKLKSKKKPQPGEENNTRHDEVAAH